MDHDWRGTRERVHDLDRQIYTTAFRNLQFGLASAFSVILFIFMLGIGYFYVKALTGGSDQGRTAH